MVNSLECLEVIDCLIRAKKAARAGLGIRDITRPLVHMRLPGQWKPYHLARAHKIALEIEPALRRFESSPTRRMGLKRIYPLIEMFAKE